VIIKERDVLVGEVDDSFIIKVDDEAYDCSKSIFFDLEHYVYKKPKCVGVFGACIYDKTKSELIVTQYMIENKYEIKDILILAEKYFLNAYEEGKRYIVTFSGNNDFTVINYLFNQYGIEFKFEDYFVSVDLQKEYEKLIKMGIGLKALEKKFDIVREGELMSGSNLAKTFHKVIKDKDYILRMPKEKIDKILQYNEQDVVNLFHICITWNKYIKLNENEGDNNSTCINE
jgi:uncharacterized protein YprB with RNaseH-like and TPR domain